jgi:hypothetical protein
MMNASPQPDVPILVETPSRPVIPMVRCHYMSIEFDDPSHVWNLGLNGFQMPVPRQNPGRPQNQQLTTILPIVDLV